MKILRILFLFMAVLCVSEIGAQTFKCVDVTFNGGDSHTTNQRIDICNQLLGTKAVVTPYDNKVLLEMYDNKDRRDASFVCEKFDNGIVKGYRYMLPNSNVGAIVIENIYPSINNIQKFKVTVVDWDKGMNMTTFYIRK